MRILRLTSAHRTCYLTVAFVTLATLQVMEVWAGDRGDAWRRVTPASAPAPVADVIDLVQTLKESRSSGLRTERVRSAAGEGAAPMGNENGR